jgi:hypothetical protein
VTETELHARLAALERRVSELESERRPARFAVEESPRTELDEEVLTIKAAAQLAKRSRQTVEAWARTKPRLAYKQGGRWCIRISRLMELLEREGVGSTSFIGN